jgi:uncharacterized membrane-anchored protein
MRISDRLRLHADCMPADKGGCQVGDDMCPALGLTAAQKLAILEERLAALTAARDAKREELSVIEIAVNSALLDVMYMSAQMEHEGTLDPRWPWKENEE